jgi:hypothetical protein
MPFILDFTQLTNIEKPLEMTFGFMWTIATNLLWE